MQVYAELHLQWTVTAIASGMEVARCLELPYIAPFTGIFLFLFCRLVLLLLPCI